MITATRLFRRFQFGILGIYTILAVAAGILGYGLAGIIHGLDAGFIILIALAGLVLGWVLSRLHWKGPSALLFLGVTGALIIVVIAGGLAGKLLSLLGAPFEDISRYHSWTKWILPDFNLTQTAYSNFAQGLTGVSSRISSWLADVQTGHAKFDPFIPTLAWGWLIWCASGWAGWSTLRGYRPLAIILPYLVIFGVGVGILRENPALLIPMLACLLLLSPLLSVKNFETDWQSREVDYSLEIRFDLATSAVLLICLILGLTILVYIIPWNEVFHPKPRQSQASSNQVENLANSFGLTLPTQVPTVLDPYLVPGLPLRHLIGSGPELTRQVVMNVKVMNRVGEQPASQVPLYWRAFTYDRYLGTGWATSSVTTVSHPAGEGISTSQSPGGKQISLRFTSTKSTAGILYYAGQLSSVDRDINLQMRSSGDIFAGYLRQNQYQVDSLIPTVDPQKLRTAGQAYPDWVKNRYLALPDTVPNRVISLALQLTSSYANAYDQAKAIESYLRDYPYTVDLPQPPQGRDVADYFLFDLKKGYCDYYATAMVVLARAAGIPARLVVGFDSGQWDAAKQEYVVHESDGHSWPEIYFPNNGWVEFEPTAGLQGEPGQFGPMQPPWYMQTPAPSTENSNAQESGEPKPIPWAWGFAGLPILLIVLIMRPVINDRHVRKLSAFQALNLIYQQLFHKEKDLRLTSEASQTPFELSAMIAQRLDGLARIRWIGKVFRPAIAELQTLINLYVEAVYSPREVPQAEFQKKYSLWQQLRTRLWIAGILASFNRQVKRN